MIKFFRKIHLWLSVPFGVFITLICFSGAMLIFEPEITRAIKSDVYYASEVKNEALPIGTILEDVKSALPDSVSITGVTVFKDKERTYQVNLSKPRRASIFVNQYTGQITGKYERLAFFSTMFKLHRWLLDSANPHGDGVKVGKMLVGISTLIFVIALISGIVIWWPRAKRGWRKSLTISFSNGWKGFWKGLHVAGGMYALIFVLAMSLTGLCL
ncbi:MAG: PepSY domain-containing protein, partial [Muribaculum intestinale]|nr:PepSY domain-containing protein [Muribaculum intestinale]